MAKLLSFKANRTPTQNALITFIAMVIAFVAFGALPTQWFAQKYGFDPNLGAPLMRAWGWAIYSPTDWLFWGWRLADVDTIKSNVHVMMMLGTASVILAIFFAMFVSSRLNKYSDGMAGLHGTAHWAEANEVNNTGFMSKGKYQSTGVVVGSVMFDRKGKIIHPHHPQYEKRYVAAYMPRSFLDVVTLRPKVEKRDSNGQPVFKLNKWVVKRIELLRDGKNTHVFAFCPTRSGKGRGMIIPTLVTWPNSVMVNDPKGEAYALTAGFRKAAGQEVIKFEPACTNGTGARWNPLDEIRIFTPYDVQDAQMIMSMACDPKGEGLEDYFDKAGYEFLMGLALHVRYAEKNGSLEGVALFLGDPNWDSDKQMYLHMMQAEHDPEGKMNWKDSAGNPTKTHPIIANVAKTMLNKEDKDRSGVLSTAKSLLSLYLDPIVAMNTNCSDFLVRDLMTHSRPVTLYFVVGPGDMERMTPLTRLFYALFIRRNAAEMEFENGRSKKSYTFPLLMILDEMTSLRKLPIIQEALGYVAGYGIRMFMLVQDIAQVEDFYGDKQTVDSGAETRVVYAPNKQETGEKIARMTGKTTVTEQKASMSRETMGIKAGSVSISTEKIGRDLMTADEIQTLSDLDVIVFVKGQPPIYGRKAWYDENPVMLARAKMPPPARSAVIRMAVTPGGIEIPKNSEKATAISAAGGGDGATGVDTGADAGASAKWAASREALRAKVAKQLAERGAPIGNAAGATPAVGGGTAEKPDGITIRPAAAGIAVSTGQAEHKTKSRSRYAEKVQVISEEEKARVSALVADVALTERVAKISAFG